MSLSTLFLEILGKNVRYLLQYLPFSYKLRLFLNAWVEVEMRFFVSACLIFSLIFAQKAKAQQVSYIEEAKTLGIVAGQGLACNSSRYDQFEMLARAIILTKAPSVQALQDGLYAYNSAKADIFLAKRKDGGYLCGEILRMFDNQDIYNITLYEDGTLKMPDGQIITPKTPYDATKIYAVNSNLQQNVNDVYQNSVNKVQQKRKQAAVYAPTSNQVENRALKVQNAPQNTVQPLVNDFSAESSVGHLSRRRR